MNPKKDQAQMFGIMYHTALNNFYVENNIKDFEYPTTLFAVMAQLLTDKEQAIATVTQLNSNKKVLKQMKKAYGLERQIQEVNSLKKKINSSKSNEEEMINAIDELNSEAQIATSVIKSESKDQGVEIQLEDGEVIFLTLHKHDVKAVSSFYITDPNNIQDIDDEEDQNE